MISVLHGDDLSASYGRLQTVLASSQNSQIIKFSSANTKEDLINAVLTRDIFENEKVIVCENFLASQKVKADDLAKFPKDASVIFWEQKQLTPSVLTKVKNYAHIEIFKEKPQIFWFLDSISPSRKNTLSAFQKMENPNEVNLIFHLANRLFLLILAKMKISKESANKITGKPMADWQWNRLENQAKNFSPVQLKKIYEGTLKLDALIKSGQTNHEPATLVPVLLIKYLQV